MGGFFSLIGVQKLLLKVFALLCRIRATTPLSSPLGARQSVSFLYLPFGKIIVESFKEVPE
jgi:hypothetical protein